MSEVTKEQELRAENKLNRTETGQNRTVKTTRLPKTHQDYWTSRLKKRSYESGGKTVEIATWQVRLTHLGRESWFNLDTANKATASVIRLITRLMFVWFIKEKGLVPDVLFDERKLPQILNGFAPAKTTEKESVFYRAILQNLFFATLNTEMDKRGWTKEEQNFMAHIADISC